MFAFHQRKHQRPRASNKNQFLIKIKQVEFERLTEHRMKCNSKTFNCLSNSAIQSLEFDRPKGYYYSSGVI